MVLSCQVEKYHSVSSHSQASHYNIITHLHNLSLFIICIISTRTNNHPSPSTMKFTSTVISAILAFASFSEAAPRNTRRSYSEAPSLTAQLRLADTAADRFALLPNDKDFVFDFNTKQENPGKGGELIAANRKTFPALVGTGSGMAFGRVDGKFALYTSTLYTGSNILSSSLRHEHSPRPPSLRRTPSRHLRSSHHRDGPREWRHGQGRQAPSHSYRAQGQHDDSLLPRLCPHSVQP
jgi:hypothetical protein